MLFALGFASLALATYDPKAVPDIIDLGAVDSAISPCENFYQYACGGWLEKLKLPEDKSSFYHQSTALDDLTLERLQSLIIKQGNNSNIGKFYASCMDESVLDQKSSALAQKYLKQIDKLQSKAGLGKLTARLHLMGVSVFFGFGPGQDLNNAQQVIGFASSGGFALPDRDYYLSQEADYGDIRREYKIHIAKTLSLLGQGDESDLSKVAEDILSLETALAQAALPLEDQWDPSKINNRSNLFGLRKLSPSFSWKEYFWHLKLRLRINRALNINEPEFFKALENVWQKYSLTQIKNYLKFHFAIRVAPYMNKSIEAENFRFWSKRLHGRAAMLPRWKKCTSEVAQSLEHDLGKIFVETIEDSRSVKSETQKLIQDVKQEFSLNLEMLDWLDAQTIEASRAKLGKLNSKVAYPDAWKSYDKLTIRPEELLLNELNSTKFESRRSMAEIGKPVDRGKWYMAPWEINAYYDASQNEMVYPYGILQEPIYSLRASDGANMGALGATVGHELTHGFDDDGSQYDGDGNAKNWWSEDVRMRFEERTQCLITQANAYEVLPDLFVNGQRSIGENIADQGGTKIAYRAYRKRASQRAPAPPVGGFNEEQQFFVSYAQSWCAKRTEESLRSMVSSDTHPPEEFRVNGVLSNMPEFARAFGCVEAKDRMAPAQRCSVW